MSKKLLSSVLECLFTITLAQFVEEAVEHLHKSDSKEDMENFLKKNMKIFAGKIKEGLDEADAEMEKSKSKSSW